MRNMKNVLAFALSAVLVASLAACGGNTAGTTTGTTAGTTTGTSADSAETSGSGEAGTSADSTETSGSGEAGALKTGLSVVTKIGSSKEAGDEDGLAQVDSTVVAVLVDADGKLVDIEIDAAQTKANFDSTGKVTTDLATEYKSKVELGDEYDMKKDSVIGKEWFEQVDALEELVIGKTSDEIVALEMADGVLVDATSSVTITATGFIEAIELAMTNAAELGAQTGDTIKLGVDTNIAGSFDVGGNEKTPDAGKVEAYSFYTSLSVDAEDMITSAIIDASQGNVLFDATGKITSDLAATQASKNVLGDDYGMKKNSSIGKEWNEQAAFFADSIKGMNASEVSGIELDDEGLVTDTDMLSGVTVHVNEMMDVVAKALAN